MQRQANMILFIQKWAHSSIKVTAEHPTRNVFSLGIPIYTQDEPSLNLHKEPVWLFPRTWVFERLHLHETVMQMFLFGSYPAVSYDWVLFLKASRGSESRCWRVKLMLIEWMVCQHLGIISVDLYMYPPWNQQFAPENWWLEC